MRSFFRPAPGCAFTGKANLAEGFYGINTVTIPEKEKQKTFPLCFFVLLRVLRVNLFIYSSSIKLHNEN